MYFWFYYRVETIPKYFGCDVGLSWRTAATTVFSTDVGRKCFIDFANDDDSTVDSSKSYFPKCGTHCTGTCNIWGVACGYSSNILYLF